MPPTAHMPPSTGRTVPPVSRNGSQRGRGRVAKELLASESPFADPSDIEKRSSPPMNSAEDITALPGNDRLDTSPHLRPVSRRDRAGEPSHNSQAQRLASAVESPVLAPPPKRGKLQRPESLRGSQNPSVQSSLKRNKAEEQGREEEARRANAQTPQSKRLSAPAGDSPLRRDSKRFRTGFSRRSEISLPMVDNGSVITGISQQYSFQAMSILSPRPTIQYTKSPHYGSRPATARGTDSSGLIRSDSKRSARFPSVPRDKAHKKTINELADALDAGALRELMERDQRRRDKKRDDEAARLRRKLERRVAKEHRKQQELERQEQAKQRAEDVENIENIHPALRPARSTDLGENQQKSIAGLGISEVVAPPAQLQKPETRPLPTPDEYIPEIPRNPFADPEPEASGSVSEPQTSAGRFRAVSQPNTPLEEGTIETAQHAVRYSQASFSPPASPVPRSPIARDGRSSTPLSSTPSRTPQLPQEPVYEEPESPEMYSPLRPPFIKERRDSDRSSKGRTGWASFSGAARRSDQLQKREAEERSLKARSQMHRGNRRIDSRFQPISCSHRGLLHLLAIGPVRLPSAHNPASVRICQNRL